jgi:hypothetical protein
MWAKPFVVGWKEGPIESAIGAWLLSKADNGRKFGWEYAMANQMSVGLPKKH